MRGCAFGRPACSICACEIERVREIAVREKMRKAIQNIRRKIQRLADLARGAAAAISDDVRGHGRAVFAVTPVNFLDDASRADRRSADRDRCPASLCGLR